MECLAQDTLGHFYLNQELDYHFRRHFASAYCQFALPAFAIEERVAPIAGVYGVAFHPKRDLVAEDLASEASSDSACCHTYRQVVAASSFRVVMASIDPLVHLASAHKAWERASYPSCPHAVAAIRPCTPCIHLEQLATAFSYAIYVAYFLVTIPVYCMLGVFIGPNIK